MTKQYVGLTENARHQGAMAIVAAGELALMLGGLAACGQGGQQGPGNQQQNQTDQMQGQPGQQDQGRQQQDRRHGSQ
jgi:hypothetical protein